MGRSIIRELLKFALQPDLISFAGGMPAPELFPKKEAEEAAHRLLTEHGEQALQYGPTEGHMPLRRWISEHMVRYGIQADADNVLITTGSQQALDLIGKLLINPGDQILVEEPTYLGALQAWNAYQAEYAGVLCDDRGLRRVAGKALRVGPSSCMYRAKPEWDYTVVGPSSGTLRLVIVRHSIVEDDRTSTFEGEHLHRLWRGCHSRQTPVKQPRLLEGNVVYWAPSRTLARDYVSAGWWLGRRGRPFS
jgi:2-aminoadipate transaminase